MTGQAELDERFDDPVLDPAVWTTSYLPAWSSRAAAAASVRSDGLHDFPDRRPPAT